MLFVDQCTGQCNNDAAVFGADIQLNTTEIDNGAKALNTTLNGLLPVILKHEFGHALRLADISLSSANTPIKGICSEVQSIMYSSSSVLYSCGVAAPTPCDVSAINAVYPSPVPSSTCSVGGNYCLDPSGLCQ